MIFIISMWLCVIEPALSSHILTIKVLISNVNTSSQVIDTTNFGLSFHFDVSCIVVKDDVQMCMFSE